MRKFLCLLLSLSLLISPVKATCFADSNCKTSKEHKDSCSSKKIVVYGDDMPTVIINSNSKAEAEAEAEAKATAKATSGTNKGIELLKIGLKIFAAYLVIKYTRTVAGTVKNFAELIMKNSDQIITSFKDTLRKMLEAMQGNEQAEKDSAEGEDIEHQGMSGGKNSFMSFFKSFLGRIKSSGDLKGFLKENELYSRSFSVSA